MLHYKLYINMIRFRKATTKCLLKSEGAITLILTTESLTNVRRTQLVTSSTIYSSVPILNGTDLDWYLPVTWNDRI